LGGSRRRWLALLLLAGCGERRGVPAARGSDGDAGAAPVVPLARLDDAHLAALEQVAPPGFTVTARDRTSASIVIALSAGDLRATVTAAPCLHCVPMELAAWRAIEPELRALMPGGLEDDPSSRFDLAVADIAGHRCISSYELGAASYGDELDTTHAARLYCNDGTTELVIRVDDDAITRAASPEAARASAARAPLESAARALAAAYLAPL